MTEDNRFRVLVADDEKPILDAYQRIFSAIGGKRVDSELQSLEEELYNSGESRADGPILDVVVCSQGEEAVASVAKARELGVPFSVVFLDVRMPPGIDGVTAAQKIRKIDMNCIIVFVTGFSDVDPAQIDAAVPPSDKILYLQKPVQTVEIQQLTRALICQWRVQRDLLLRIAEVEHENTALRRALRESGLVPEGPAPACGDAALP